MKSLGPWPAPSEPRPLAVASQPSCWCEFPPSLHINLTPTLNQLASFPCFPWALLYCSLGMLPAHHNVTAPTSTLYHSHTSARSTVSWASSLLTHPHLYAGQVDFGVTRASVQEHLSCLGEHTFFWQAAEWSCNLFLFLYKVMLLRLQWRIKHLHRRWIIFLSKLLTMVRKTS